MKVIDINGGSNRKLVYTSPAMHRVVSDAELFAPSDIPIVITGSNGTGKDNVARHIHHISARKDKPFVAINCAAISPGVIESELFGHEKGSFTGASTRRIGKFEEAKDGTLFLDEIGEMPAEMQTKLLRVLQDGEFSRVGGNETIVASPRIIAATNRNVENAIKEGKLREDLYYRLRGVQIEVPDLKHRVSDIPLLAEYYAQQAATQYHLNTPTIRDDAMAALIEYSWPGNVRELGNRITEAVFRAQASGVITADILKLSAGKGTMRLSNDGTPVEETFGYKISQLREDRRWTQSALANKINSNITRTYSQKDVRLWEDNVALPDRETINCLAYLLIVSSQQSQLDKQRELEQFYTYAEEAEQFATHGGTFNPQHNFGQLLAAFRDRAGLDHAALAAQVSNVSGGVPITAHDLYLIEANDAERRITPRESLALVKALDTRENPLSVKEKTDLHESAQRIFVRSSFTQKTHGLAGNDNDRPVAPHSPAVSDAVTRLANQRHKLLSYFVDSTGHHISSARITEMSGVRPQVAATIIGHSKVNPLDIAHAVEDVTMNKFTACLKSLGRGDDVIAQFTADFKTLASIAAEAKAAEVDGGDPRAVRGH